MIRGAVHDRTSDRHCSDCRLWPGTGNHCKGDRCVAAASAEASIEDLVHLLALRRRRSRLAASRVAQPHGGHRRPAPRHRLIEQREGRLELTPRGLRKIGSNALRDLFDKLAKDKVGQHQMDRLGQGHERTYETKQYEYGDPFNLGADKDADFLRMALPDEIATTLSAVRTLSASRTPANEPRLNGPLRTYTPAVPLF